MRLGVLDVGSNTVHLLVVDARLGGHPTPALSHKSALRLASLLDDDGALSATGAQQLVAAVAEARQVAQAWGVEDLVAFATSAVRDATNSVDVLADVRACTGVDLSVLSGEDEARLTFLAVRRWFGWSAGRLLCLDIGGGSLELATGLDEEPDLALSLPLGAGRLTRDRLPGDPPAARAVRALEAYVVGQVGPAAEALAAAGAPDRVVGTSKTFRSLARICGAAPSSAGPRAPRTLGLDDLRRAEKLLLEMPVARRADLPGVSVGRAGQLLAGAMVARAAMEATGTGRLQICPWALREGMVLRRLDWLAGDV